MVRKLLGLTLKRAEGTNAEMERDKNLHFHSVENAEKYLNAMGKPSHKGYDKFDVIQHFKGRDERTRYDHGQHDASLGEQLRGRPQVYRFVTKKRR